MFEQTLYHILEIHFSNPGLKPGMSRWQRKAEVGLGEVIWLKISIQVLLEMKWSASKKKTTEYQDK